MAYDDAGTGYQGYPGAGPTSGSDAAGDMNHWLFGGPNYYDTRGSMTPQGWHIFNDAMGLYDFFGKQVNTPFKLNLGGQTLNVMSPFARQTLKSLTPLLQALMEYETGRKGSIASSGTEKGNWGSVMSMIGGGMASDENLKDKIEPVIVSEDDIAKLKQLKGVSFNWKGTDVKSAGVIAQDVQKVFPECVSKIPNTNLLMVDYGTLLSKAIGALQMA